MTYGLLSAYRRMVHPVLESRDASEERRGAHNRQNRSLILSSSPFFSFLEGLGITGFSGPGRGTLGRGGVFSLGRKGGGAVKVGIRSTGGAMIFGFTAGVRRKGVLASLLP